MGGNRKSEIGTRQSLAAFTLIELMVVVGIIAVVMTMAIPTIYRQLHPESMQKAVSDIMEACSHARATAILNGTESVLTIMPQDRQIQVGSGGAAKRGEDRLFSPDVSGEDWRLPEERPRQTESAHFSARLSDRIQIEGIRLNYLDYTEDERVDVRFYPNGTCDEFSIFLLSDKGERRQIFLEVVTGLADVESDPNKFR
jgi:prepilin-type N-terminal cleavage/methylation domain-containing protein